MARYVWYVKQNRRFKYSNEQYKILNTCDKHSYDYKLH